MPSCLAISLPIATSSPVTILTARPSFSVSAMVSLASGRGGSSSDRRPTSVQVWPSVGARHAQRPVAVAGELVDLAVILAAA